jgi:hypothetical protein
MNLIEEIENSGKPWASQVQNDSQVLGLDAARLVGSPWWLRIKAALEAGQEMQKVLWDLWDEKTITSLDLALALRHFKEAMK